MKKILIVDDEEFNLDILQEYIEFAGHEVVRAVNGKEAEDILNLDQSFSTIILDRMMPIMDGITLTKRIKESEKLKNIPIIMQTAMSSPEQVSEGIKAGVFYYLSKPYVEETLTAILASALEQYDFINQVNEKSLVNANFMSLMESSVFKFSTIEDAKSLSMFISSNLSSSERLLLGLNEITINAIEHGNLGITYDEKKSLLQKGLLQQEILSRLANSDKQVTLTFKNNPNNFEIIVEDMGQGFDYKKSLEISPDRITDPNGRGIAMSKIVSFDEIEYLGSGNKVRCLMNKN